MLRQYDKKAKENIRQYIIAHFDCTGYDVEEPTDFDGVAQIIWDVFNKEVPALNHHATQTSKRRFENWCQGLPSVIDTCYYYNRSAIDDLAAILEMSEEEKAKWHRDGDSERVWDFNYDKEREAELRITNMIFAAIRDAVNGYNN